MAGSRIKGITVEIGGDTTKLQSALKGVNSEIKNTQSQLKNVEKLLKYDTFDTIQHVGGFPSSHRHVVHSIRSLGC